MTFFGTKSDPLGTLFDPWLLFHTFSEPIAILLGPFSDPRPSWDPFFWNPKRPSFSPDPAPLIMPSTITNSPLSNHSPGLDMFKNQKRPSYGVLEPCPF